MDNVFIPTGKLAARYARRGAAKSHHGLEMRLFTVDGQLVHLREIRERINAGERTHKQVAKRLQRMKLTGPLTWDRITYQQGQAKCSNN